MFNTNIKYRDRSKVRQILFEAELEIEVVLKRKVICNFEYFFSKNTEEQIRLAVVEKMNVSWDEIRGKERYIHVANARFVYAYLLRTLLGYKLAHIAKMIGRDHTSVMYAIKRVEDMIDINDDRICNKISEITKKITQGNEQ